MTMSQELWGSPPIGAIPDGKGGWTMPLDYIPPSQTNPEPPPQQPVSTPVVDNTPPQQEQPDSQDVTKTIVAEQVAGMAVSGEQGKGKGYVETGGRKDIVLNRLIDSGASKETIADYIDKNPDVRYNYGVIMLYQEVKDGKTLEEVNANAFGNYGGITQEQYDKIKEYIRLNPAYDPREIGTMASAPLGNGRIIVDGIDSNGKSIAVVADSESLYKTQGMTNLQDKLDSYIKLGILPEGTKLIGDGSKEVVEAFNKEFGTDIQPDFPFAVPNIVKYTETNIELKRADALNPDGSIDVLKAISAGVSLQTLRDLGIKESDIKQAQEYIRLTPIFDKYVVTPATPSEIYSETGAPLIHGKEYDVNKLVNSYNSGDITGQDIETYFGKDTLGAIVAYNVKAEEYTQAAKNEIANIARDNNVSITDTGDMSKDDLVLLIEKGVSPAVLIAGGIGLKKVNDAINVVNDKYEKWQNANAKIKPYGKSGEQLDANGNEPFIISEADLVRYQLDNPEDKDTIALLYDEKLADKVNKTADRLKGLISDIDSNPKKWGEEFAQNRVAQLQAERLGLVKAHTPGVITAGDKLYGQVYIGETMIGDFDKFWNSLNKTDKINLVEAISKDPNRVSAFAAFAESLSDVQQKLGTFAGMVLAPVTPITSVVAKQITLPEARKILNDTYSEEINAVKDYVKKDGTVDIDKVKSQLGYDAELKQQITGLGYEDTNIFIDNLEYYNNGMKVTNEEWAIAGATGALDVLMLGGAGALATGGLGGRLALGGIQVGSAAIFLPSSIRTIRSKASIAEKTLAGLMLVMLVAGGVLSVKAPSLSTINPLGKVKVPLKSGGGQGIGEIQPMVSNIPKPSLDARLVADTYDAGYAMGNIIKGEQGGALETTGVIDWSKVKALINKISSEEGKGITTTGKIDWGKVKQVVQSERGGTAEVKGVVDWEKIKQSINNLYKNEKGQGIEVSGLVDWDKVKQNLNNLSSERGKGVGVSGLVDWDSVKKPIVELSSERGGTLETTGKVDWENLGDDVVAGIKGQLYKIQDIYETYTDEFADGYKDAMASKPKAESWVRVLQAQDRAQKIAIADQIAGTVENSVTSKQQNETVWKGLKIGDNIIVGVSDGKLIFGKSGIKLPPQEQWDIPLTTVEGKPFEPRTGLETNALINEKALETAGMTTEEAKLFTERMKNTLAKVKKWVGKPEKNLNEALMLEPIDTFSAEGVETILKYCVENSNKIKNIRIFDRLYGSSTIKAQLSPEALAEWVNEFKRMPGDFDIQLKDVTAEGAAQFAKDLVERLNKETKDSAWINPDNETLIMAKSRSTGAERHGVDIHYPDEPTTEQPLSPDTEGMVYGLQKTQPVLNINIKGIGNFKIARLSETAVGKMEQVAGWRWNPESKIIELAIEPHRFPKDIIDLYEIMKSNEGGKVADEWLELMGYDKQKLIDLQQGIVDKTTTANDKLVEATQSINNAKQAIKSGDTESVKNALSEARNKLVEARDSTVDMPQTEAKIAYTKANKAIQEIDDILGKEITPELEQKLSDINRNIDKPVGRELGDFTPSDDASISNIGMESPVVEIISPSLLSAATSYPIGETSDGNIISMPLSVPDYPSYKMARISANNLYPSGSIQYPSQLISEPISPSGVSLNKKISKSIFSIQSEPVLPSILSPSEGISPSDIVSPSEIKSPSISQPPSELPSPSEPISPSIPSPSELKPPSEPPSRGIPIKLGDAKYQEQVAKIVPGTLVWKQGNPTYKNGRTAPMYKVKPPPYTKEVSFTMREPPPGYRDEGFSGKGSAFKSLQIIGGNPPSSVKNIDLGIMRIDINMEGGKPVISYAQDEEANVGERSQTIGMGKGQIPVAEWEKAKQQGISKSELSQRLNKQSVTREVATAPEVEDIEEETPEETEIRLRKPKNLKNWWEAPDYNNVPVVNTSGVGGNYYRGHRLLPPNLGGNI